MNLYQQAKNINRILGNPENMPYSGIIMEKLGAKLVNYRQVPKNIGKGSANNSIWFFYS
jgi:heterodisulfide reductase subunit B